MPKRDVLADLIAIKERSGRRGGRIPATTATKGNMGAMDRAQGNACGAIAGATRHPCRDVLPALGSKIDRLRRAL